MTQTGWIPLPHVGYCIENQEDQKGQSNPKRPGNVSCAQKSFPPSEPGPSERTHTSAHTVSRRVFHLRRAQANEHKRSSTEFQRFLWNVTKVLVEILRWNCSPNLYEGECYWKIKQISLHGWGRGWFDWYEDFSIGLEMDLFWTLAALVPSHTRIRDMIRNKDSNHWKCSMATTDSSLEILENFAFIRHNPHKSRQF